MLVACVRIDLLSAYLFCIFNIYVIRLMRFFQQAVNQSLTKRAAAQLWDSCGISHYCAISIGCTGS